MANGLTLPQILARRANAHRDRIAVKFVADDETTTQWSYGELWARVSAVAETLNDQAPKIENAIDAGDAADAMPGGNQPRALLLFPAGLDSIAAFFGAQLAGYIPVPTCYPEPHREIPRLNSAATDCAPELILCDQATCSTIATDKLSKAAAAATRIAVDGISPADGKSCQSACRMAEAVSPDSVAFLQYTSGSTNEPKGVIVTHANLSANVDAIQRGFAAIPDGDSNDVAPHAVFWLPFYHDMGLIGGILTPIAAGYTSVYLSPRAFLQRPLRWLQLISDYKARISGAPNFAYQLCTDRISPEQTDGLDLSSWKTAFCGAEPIVYRTLHDFASRFSACGFQDDAFYPCYGLAEATLLAAGGDGPGEIKSINVRRSSLETGTPEICEDGRGGEFQRLVSSGQPAHQTDVWIVDPETRQRCPEKKVGEIWLRGPGISRGYWGRDETNAEHFSATTVCNQSGFCRTGDFGFIDQNELYVTGRLKDLIILRGRNLYPQDIEATAKASVGNDVGQVVAMTVAAPRGEALAIVAEVPRDASENDLHKFVHSIRRDVIEVHEVDPRHVLLVRPASVPITTSGKVQRSRCAAMFVADEFTAKFRYDRSSASEQSPIAIPRLPERVDESNLAEVTDDIVQWMNEWLVARASVPPDDLAPDTPFAVYGLDSMTAVEMSGELEDWSGVNVTPESAFAHPTVADLSGFVAGELKNQTAG